MDKELTKFILGVDPEIIHKKVVIAPCWLPASVGVKDAEIVSDGPCKIWKCNMKEISFTYIVSGVGAANCLDIVMALGDTKCRDILFIGSAGALDRSVDIGDIAIPENIVCAEGASRFIGEKLSVDCYGNKFASCIDISKQLIDFLINNDVLTESRLHIGDGISVESIAMQYEHISEFISNGCKFIDMESSAFLAACKRTGINGTIAYCISDNVSIGEPLYLVSDATTQYRKNVRKEIFPLIIECYLAGENDGI